VAQKNVLGKGLASLIPIVDNSVDLIKRESDFSSAERHPGISLLPLDKISVNPNQPRKDFDISSIEDLSRSIKENGLVQPLVVRRVDNRYELIAGERRLRAAKMAGIIQLPVVIRKSTDRESLELALVENIQRENLNCVEEALAYLQLIEDFSLTQEEVAKKVGKDRTSVSNTLRLLRLPNRIVQDLRKGTISFGHGKVLLGIEETERQLKIHGAILVQNLSVRQTEELVKNQKQSPEVGVKTPTFTRVAERLRNLSQELTKFWSAKVYIKGSENKGKIVIQYNSSDELDRILSNMQ